MTQDVRLTTRAERAALRAIRHACDAKLDALTLREEVAHHAAKVVPVDACALTVTDPDSGLFTHSWSDRLPSSFFRTFVEELYVDEVLAFLDLARSGRVISTHASRRYDEVLQAEGFGGTLHGALSAGGRLQGCWCMFREPSSPKFGEKEARFVRAAAPHIGRGLRAAAAMERPAGRTPAAPAVVAVNARWQVSLRSGPAAEYLEDLADVRSDSSSLVPSAVASLLTRLEQLSSNGSNGSDGTHAELRAPGRSGRHYLLRACRAEDADARGPAIVIIIEPAQANAPLASAALRFGLTAREQEVLTRVVHGDSTKQVAARLGVSTYTVQDHLGRACEKVGARGRGELLAKLFLEQEAGAAPAG